MNERTKSNIGRLLRAYDAENDLASPRVSHTEMVLINAVLELNEVNLKQNMQIESLNNSLQFHMKRKNPHQKEID